MTLAKLSNNWMNSFPTYFDRFFENDLMDWNGKNYSKTNTTLPAVNIQENENEFVIDVAVPGFKKEDFQVNYENGLLSISSELKNESEDSENGKYTRREFSYQSFKRSFTVADKLVDGDKITANYENGLLHITLPKREEAKPKPKREIEIL